MFVRAAEGRQVRRPDTLTLLRPEGEEVPDDDFWFRRVSEGDVIRQTQPDAKSKTEPDAPPEAKARQDAPAPDAAPAKSQDEGDNE